MTFQISGPAARYLPPHDRPHNECAGYLGYYTRCHLDVQFDLVDLDSCWPTIWLQWKAKKHVLRLFEEKLLGQDLHVSQHRTYAVLAGLIKLGIREGQLHKNSGVYIIRDADQLMVPVFPVELDRLNVYGNVEKSHTFERDEFNDWLLQEDES